MVEKVTKLKAGSFVVAKPNTDEDGPFWLAEVQVDVPPDTAVIPVRWFTPTGRSKDVIENLNGKWVPALKCVKRKKVPWCGKIDKETIRVHSFSLTASGKQIPVPTKRVIANVEEFGLQICDDNQLVKVSR